MGESRYWERARSTRLTRRSVIRGGTLGAAGLAGAALIGCGDDDDDPTPTSTPTQSTGGPSTPAATGTAAPGGEGSPRAGGRYEWFYATGPGSFNPIEASAEGRDLSGRHVYDRLLAARLDDRIYVLEAAESVELTDDVTVVAKLHDGLVYQDKNPVNGRAVTTEDIVQVQEYARESTLANNGFQVGSLDSMETPDDQTIVFHLRAPNAYLFTGQGLGHADTMAIIPSELMDNLAEHQPIGSGPYHLAEFQMDSSYTYQRNPTFRLNAEGLPYIDERLVRILPDTAAQEAAFRARQIHAQYIPTVDTAERVITDLGDEITVTEYTAINGFEWTMCARRTKTDWDTVEIFEDPRIREGFYRIHNQQQFTDLIDNGQAENCPGTMSVALSRYLVDWADVEEYRRYDVEAGRQLLDAAGWDFDREYTITTLPGARNDGGIQIMQQQLSEIGVRTTAVVAPNPEWLSAICEPGRYDFSIAGHPDYDTPLQPLRQHHTDPQQRNNTGNLGDPEVDAMIEESERTLDADENVALVKQIQIELLSRYAHRVHINNFFARELQWQFVRDWETSPVTRSHINYQHRAWLDL